MGKKVVKLREGEGTILIPTELPAAKLRSIRDYCQEMNEVPSAGSLFRLSKSLARIIEREKIVTPYSFAKSVEESLREIFWREYGEDGKTFCNIARIYVLELILPSVLAKEQADAIRGKYS